MTIVLGLIAALAALVGLGALIALPAIAIVHFGKTDYVPAGVTAHEVDTTVWPLYGMGGEAAAEYNEGWRHYSMDDFLSAQPSWPDNPVQRAIKEHELRLGREE